MPYLFERASAPKIVPSFYIAIETQMLMFSCRNLSR